MANAWIELSQTQFKSRGRSLAAAILPVLLVTSCSSTDPADQVVLESKAETAVDVTLDGSSFASEIGSFNPSGDVLAVVEGQKLLLTYLDRSQRLSKTIDQSVTELVFADDDSLWLSGHDGVSYWRGGDEQCSTESLGDSPRVFEVTLKGLDLVAESYVDGSGVFGERISVGTDCAVDRGTKKQTFETAISKLGNGRKLVARAATIDAGPTRRQGPVVEHRVGNTVLAELSVFEEQPDISKISAIVGRDDRVIALGTGAEATHWELWTIENPRLVSSKQLAQPSNQMLSFANTDHVIIGQELVDLTSGQGQPLIGSGVIQDVTDDQSWWLIAEDGQLSLRSAQSLKDQ